MDNKSRKAEKNSKTRPNTASNDGANITKKPFFGSWEGLKSQKLVQILPITRTKNSQKSQF